MRWCRWLRFTVPMAMVVRSRQVVVAIHHLSVDVVSWPVLIEDFATAACGGRRW